MVERQPNLEATGLPSGYVRAELMPFQAVVDGTVLPWLGDKQRQFSVAECEVQGGVTFLLASAISTHAKLTEAANRLNVKQQGNVDNMMYSRLPPFIEHHRSPLVDIMENPITPFPVYVMKNQGGQRVYFAKTNLPTTDGTARNIVVRLGVCDKSDQELVCSVLGGTKSQMNRVRKA